MDQINMNTTVNDGVQSVNQAQTDPVHQYATTVPPNAQAVQTVTPYYGQQVSAYPLQQTAMSTSQALAAGMFGLIVVSTGVMGANLHKVGDNDMTINEAVKNSLVKGAVGGVAAASATAVTTSLTSGGIAGLAVTLATATGVSYLLTR